MRGVNKVILIGHLGKDPEVRHLDNNTAVANFTLATTESYTNREGKRVENTEWHNIVMWRKLAEIAERFLKKGSFVYIEGKLTSRSWDDKEGNKRYITEVVANNMQMLDKKSDDGGGYSAPSAPAQSTSSKPGNEVVLDEPGDDLPF